MPGTCPFATKSQLRIHNMVSYTCVCVCVCVCVCKREFCWNLNPSTLEHDLSQYVGSVICVFAQQYSSPTSVSLHFHIGKEKYYFNCCCFFNAQSLKLRQLKLRKSRSVCKYLPASHEIPSQKTLTLTLTASPVFISVSLLTTCIDRQASFSHLVTLQALFYPDT